MAKGSARAYASADPFVCRLMRPHVYSPDNLIQLVALTGTSRGQSLLPESRRQWKPGAGRFEISPQSHPDERPAVPSIADDLRRPAGQVDRVGGIRYLPHEWASAFASHLRQPQIVAEETRTPSGVVPREHVSRPGTGRRRAILRAFPSPGTLATCDAPLGHPGGGVACVPCGQSARCRLPAQREGREHGVYERPHEGRAIQGSAPQPAQG